MSRDDLATPVRSRITVRATLWFLLRQIAIAVPFALFFGLLNGGSAHAYWLALRASLIIALTIGLAVRANEHHLVPRLLRRACVAPGDALDGRAFLRHAGSYALASFVGALAGAFVVDLLLIPDLLEDSRSLAIFLAFTVLFTALFMSYAYAVEFHRSNVRRARNEERMRGELSRAELRALRAQINPHFLFNTLNSIAALIAVDPVRAEAITEELAEIFRYALRASDREWAPLGQELTFARSYLDIERARMGERLQVEEEVDARALECEVPSLLLQPLVENAVLHGVAPCPAGGRVRIAIVLNDGRLTIEVEDDGVGIANGAMDANGFGLRSVRDRLRMLGPGHDLEVESPARGGTLVRVAVPAVTAHSGCSQ